MDKLDEALRGLFEAADIETIKAHPNGYSFQPAEPDWIWDCARLLRRSSRFSIKVFLWSIVSFTILSLASFIPHRAVILSAVSLVMVLAMMPSLLLFLGLATFSCAYWIWYTPITVPIDRYVGLRKEGWFSGTSREQRSNYWELRRIINAES